MKSLIKALEQTGLTSLQAKVYSYILANEPCKVTDVYKGLKHDKSSTYRVVNELLERGLLISLGEKYGEEFMTSGKAKISDHIATQHNSLKVASDAISSAIDNIFLQKKSEYLNHNITIFEGEDSYLKLMEKKLEIAKSPIRSISNIESTIQSYPKYEEFIKEFIPLRVAKGMKQKVLACTTNKSKNFLASYLESDENLLKEVKYLPESFKIQASLSTFGEYTAIRNKYKKRNLAILIKDNYITELFNSMYDLIWELI